MDLLGLGELILAGIGSYTVLRYISKPKRNVIKQNIIAKIQLYGEITEYSHAYSPMKDKREITSGSVEELVERALKDKVKGIIFEIDSPGGTVVPSKEIGDYIKEIKVPTVALVKGCAASGGYWIASACDKIVANPFSIVGSIGVILSHIEISKLAKKHGIEYDGVHAGKYKDMGNIFRPFTEEEREILQEEIDFTHKKFIEEIAKNRKMKVEEVKELATGLTYIGEKALQLKLVDKLGGLKEAKKLIERKGKFKDSKVLKYEQKGGLFSKINTLTGAMGKSFAEGMYKSISNNKPELR